MTYTHDFDAALAHASGIHRSQTRKGSEVPYITHLLSVAAIVGENDGTEDEVIAALLHDAIEDTEETEETIRARFGDEVAEIVAGCTDADVAPGEAKPEWRPRKEAYIAHIREAPASVRLVSSADKLHNARSILSDHRRIGDELWSRFTGRRDGTLWYYRSLVEAFEEADDGTDGRLAQIISELRRVVEDIHDAAGETWPGTSRLGSGK